MGKIIPGTRGRVWPGRRVSGMILPMQGFERMDGELLDTAVGRLVPAGGMFAFLAAHRAEGVPDADYAGLFAPPGGGRPSPPATPVGAGPAVHGCHDFF